MAMSQKEFDQKMNEAQDRLFNMKRETSLEEVMYKESRANLLWADLMMKPQNCQCLDAGGI